jgi:hypothetical protein
MNIERQLKAFRDIKQTNELMYKLDRSRVERKIRWLEFIIFCQTGKYPE